MSRVYNPKQKGFTFLEIIIVIMILAIIAAVALPNLSSTDYKKLDIAAEEVAQAIRFSRLEAIRNSAPYGVYFSTSADQIKVYRLDGETPTYDVRHPVDKKLYILNLTTDTTTKNVALFSYSISFQGVSGNQQYLGFSEQGIPKYFQNGADHMLSETATITLSFAEQTRVISATPMIGRVTVQ